MALEYSLVLLGSLSPEALVVRAFPEPAQRPEFKISDQAWHADLNKSMGFELVLAPGTKGYFEAAAGADPWAWEPACYLNVGFRFDKFFPRDVALRHMLAIVARVLSSGDEDAALILNGDALRLRREAGTLARFDGGFWDKLAPETVPVELRKAS